MSVKRIIKSPFVHIYQQGGKVCLYHALYIQNIYGESFLLTLFELFKKPQTLENILEIFPTHRQQVKDTIASLINNGILKYYEDKKEENLITKWKEKALKEEVRFLYLIPTTRCNLRCKYCHIMNESVKCNQKDMSVKIAKRGIDLFVKYCSLNNENKEIMFYGGEPLLNEPLIRWAVTHIREKEPAFNGKVNIIIFTNGTNISSEMANFLAENRVYIVVSIDGPKHVHNQMRITMKGKGSFSEVEQGYFVYRKAGCEVGISMVASKHNVPDLENCVQYLLQHFEPLDLGISTLHLFSNGKNPAEMPISELTDSLIRTFELTRNEGTYVEHLFRRVRPFVERQPRLKDCPSCGGKFVVTPDSRVGFCEAFIGLGHFFYDLFSFDIQSNDGYKLWNMITPLTRPGCLKCPAIAICGGGCPYDAYARSGNIRNRDTIRCEQSKRLLEWLVWDLWRQINKPILSKWDIIIPTLSERRRIYSKVNINGTIIPLQNYSKFGEG